MFNELFTLLRVWGASSHCVRRVRRAVSLQSRDVTGVLCGLSLGTLEGGNTVGSLVPARKIVDIAFVDACQFLVSQLSHCPRQAARSRMNLLLA